MLFFGDYRVSELVARIKRAFIEEEIFIHSAITVVKLWQPKSNQRQGAYDAILRNS